MTESAAICQYLCSKISQTSLDVLPQTLVLRYSRFELEARRNPAVSDDYMKWFLARLRALDARLAVQDFLCAGCFTAADVSVDYGI